MHRKDISGELIAEWIPKEFQHIPWYHFSVDDVFDSLIEVTKKDIPLFEHPFFALMKELHDEYGTQVDLELFYEKEIDGSLCTLQDVRDISREIEDAGGWLKFGPHAQSYMVAPFEQSPTVQEEVFNRIYNEVDRFAGKQSYATWVRLHFYSESFELADYFQSKGVNALFTTDRPVGSHRMPEAVAQMLLEDGFAPYGTAHFIRTQFRIEVFTNGRATEADLEAMFLHALKTYGFITFYSHEYEFARSEIRNMVRTTFRVLDRLGVRSIQQPSQIS